MSKKNSSRKNAPRKPREGPQPAPETDSGDRRDMVLCHEDAQGGCPDDIAACGEEDIGVGLEQLVSRREDH